MTPETLALIPARGGSKGLPRKNLAELGGLPLIAWSIRAALACPGIGRVVVSTEDEEIAAVAREHGAEAPFLRPAELAQDASDLGQALEYTVNRLAREGYHPHSVAHLAPTSPFRPAALLERLVARLHQGHRYVHTARAFGPRPCYRMEDGRAACAALDWRAPLYFRGYGVFTGHCLGEAPLPNYVEFVDDPVLCIDIDTPEDFRRAQEAIALGLVAA